LTTTTTNRRVYRIVFHCQGQIWELHCRAIEPSNLLGFVSVEEILFGERSQIVLDPTEEKLRTELAGVRRCFVPIHSVIRIDEVEKEGTNRIVPAPKGDGSNVAHFPTPFLGRPSDGEKKKD
jgi:hypothetical protein